MQRTPTTSARPAARRVVFMALLGALLLLALAQAVPALGRRGLHRRSPRPATTRSTWPTTTRVYALRFSADRHAARRGRHAVTRPAPVLREGAHQPDGHSLAAARAGASPGTRRPSSGCRSATTGRSFPTVTTGAGGRHHAPGTDAVRRAGCTALIFIAAAVAAAWLAELGEGCRRGRRAHLGKLAALTLAGLILQRADRAPAARSRLVGDDTRHLRRHRRSARRARAAGAPQGAVPGSPGARTLDVSRLLARPDALGLRAGGAGRSGSRGSGGADGHRAGQAGEALHLRDPPGDARARSTADDGAGPALALTGVARIDRIVADVRWRHARSAKHRGSGRRAICCSPTVARSMIAEVTPAGRGGVGVHAGGCDPDMGQNPFSAQRFTRDGRRATR